MLASTKFNLKNELENDMFNHVVYVSNQILMSAKKTGLSKDTFEKSGKLLWRLFNVLQAYNAKKRDVTFQSIISIVKEFKTVFSGT